MVDDDGKIFVFKVLVQKVAQLRLRPNQMDPHWQSLASEDRSPDLRLWCFVGAYGVKRNVDEHVALPRMMYPEPTALKSTRPSGSGDPANSCKGRSIPGNAREAQATWQLL
jgi:hypothetical protein